MKNLKTLIPYPNKVEVTSEQYFNLSLQECSFTGKDNYVELFNRELRKSPQSKQIAKACQVSIIETPELASEDSLWTVGILPAEAYHLIITDAKIEIKVSSERGLFYALQTLKQLLYFNKGKLFPLIIEDSPALKWRGLHLDISRHFFTAEDIYSLLDRMAELKLNVFHLHLSDDQGWRIESKVFPKLTEIGAKRQEDGGSIYTGFLTQDEIKEIVAYAGEKMIMVVPEIDLPGHTQAMISSYPFLSCMEEESKVWNEWGVSNQILCASKPQVYDFLKKLLEELIPLFPAPYFHIGGDECPTTQWESCPSCNKVMKDKGYSSYRDLQAEVTNFLSTLLKKHNKTLIGWDEIAEFSCPEGAVLTCWRGDGKQAVLNAKKQNLDYIVSPNHPMYLDWRQSSNTDEFGGFGVTSLSDVYNFDYGDLISDSMLGMQANIWTERIETATKLEYMAFPRIIALAENCWTTLENKDYNRFLVYLKRYLTYYDDLYINYCTSNLDSNNKFIKEELITRDDISSELLELNDVSSVFNPGAIKIENTFYLLMRVQNRGRETFLVKAESENGRDFTTSDEPVTFIGLDRIKEQILHIYDPRLTMINKIMYVLTAIDTTTGCFLGLFTTQDLEILSFMGLVSDPDVRNGVLFPEKIAGKYARLERPNKSTLENGTKSGSEIYLSTSDDLIKWSNPKFVMSGHPHYWDELIGSGPVPIKTRYGWLHIYHGVATHFASANIYQAGFTFLDLEDPSKVLFRSKYNILEPRETYETIGQVPNVVFPTGLIASLYDHDGFVKDDSSLFLYYGAADTSIGLVETNLRFFIEKMLTEEGL